MTNFLATVSFLGPLLVAALLVTWSYVMAPTGRPKAQDRYRRLLCKIAGRPLHLPDYEEIEALEKEVRQLDPLNQLTRPVQGVIDASVRVAGSTAVTLPLIIRTHCMFCGDVPPGVSHKASCPLFKAGMSGSEALMLFLQDIQRGYHQ